MQALKIASRVAQPPSPFSQDRREVLLEALSLAASGPYLSNSSLMSRVLVAENTAKTAKARWPQ